MEKIVAEIMSNMCMSYEQIASLFCSFTENPFISATRDFQIGVELFTLIY